VLLLALVLETGLQLGPKCVGQMRSLELALEPSKNRCAGPNGGLGAVSTNALIEPVEPSISEGRSMCFECLEGLFGRYVADRSSRNSS